MSLRPRTIALTLALLSTGALPVVAASAARVTCCPDDGDRNESPLSECPLGITCGCCTPMRSLAVARLEPAPIEPFAFAVPTVTHEPALGLPLTDIFHPPRA